MSLDGNYDAPKPTVSPEMKAAIGKLKQKIQQGGGTKIKYGANCGNIPKYAIQFPSTPTAPTTPTILEPTPKYGINSGGTVPTTPTMPTAPTSFVNTRYGINCGTDGGTKIKYGLNIGGATSTPRYGLNCGLKGSD